MEKRHNNGGYNLHFFFKRSRHAPLPLLHQFDTDIRTHTVKKKKNSYSGVRVVHVPLLPNHPRPQQVQIRSVCKQQLKDHVFAYMRVYVFELLFCVCVFSLIVSRFAKTSACQCVERGKRKERGKKTAKQSNPYKQLRNQKGERVTTTKKKCRKSFPSFFLFRQRRRARCATNRAASSRRSAAAFSRAARSASMRADSAAFAFLRSCTMRRCSAARSASR